MTNKVHDVTKQQRAAAMVRAADAAIAKVHGHIDDATMMASLVLSAVMKAVPDADFDEIKSALRVKRPISRRQWIRGWVSDCICGEGEKPDAMLAVCQTPAFLKTDEVIDRIMEDDPTFDLKDPKKNEDKLVKVIATLLKEKMSGK
jgi:hypothetical protein